MPVPWNFSPRRDPCWGFAVDGRAEEAFLLFFPGGFYPQLWTCEVSRGGILGHNFPL